MAKTTTQKAQPTNANDETIRNVTNEIVNGLAGTLVINKDALKALDKEAKKAIIAMYDALNKEGTSFSCRVYQIHQDKNGNAFTFLSQYALRINNETPSEFARANLSGVYVRVKGVAPGEYNGGLMIRGSVKLIEADEGHTVPTLFRSAVASVL